MHIQCIDNNGFEDQLTDGQRYRVITALGNSIQLRDDRGCLRWYGRVKFSDPVCRTCTPQRTEIHRDSPIP